MITNEMKARVFYLYPFAKIMYADTLYRLKSIDVDWDKMEIAAVGSGVVDTVRISGSAQLLLTPLSEITDEDAIEVCKIIGGLPTDEVIVRDTKSAAMVYSPHNDGGMLSTDGRLVINYKDFEIYWYSDGNVHEPDSNRCLQIIDFLRSKSYALPYMSIDLFESGIAIPNNKNMKDRLFGKHYSMGKGCIAWYYRKRGYQLIEREAERYAKEIWADHYINVLPESVIEKGRKGYADAAIHGANFALEMERWVKIQEGGEMPESDNLYGGFSVDVLLTDGYNCGIGYYRSKSNDWYSELGYAPTHWQPLPKLPQ